MSEQAAPTPTQVAQSAPTQPTVGVSDDGIPTASFNGREWIPRNRFNDAMAKAKEEAAQYASALADARAKAAEAEKLQRELGAVRERAKLDRLLTRAGADEEALDEFYDRYSRVQPDESGKKPTIEEFFEGAKGKKWALGYFAQPAATDKAGGKPAGKATETAADTAAKPPPKQPPDPNAGVRGDQPGHRALTLAEWDSLPPAEQMRRTPEYNAIARAQGLPEIRVSDELLKRLGVDKTRQGI